MTTMSHRSLVVAAAMGSLAAAFMPSHANAADASAWSEDVHSAVRLIAGSGRDGAGALRAGVDVKIEHGWKTYWRYPGDAGVPPRFDWSGSGNLKSAVVQFPAPHAFEDESGISIGYKSNVVFPVSVTPVDPSKPVTLKLKIDYAVCEKLCFPAQGDASLPLDGAASASDATLAAADRLVPARTDAASIGLTARRVKDGEKQAVLVELPATKGDLAMFAEGPTAEWALPVPKSVAAGSADRRAFRFAVDGLPPGTNPAAPFVLNLTIVGGDRALEVSTRLD